MFFRAALAGHVLDGQAQDGRRGNDGLRIREVRCAVLRHEHAQRTLLVCIRNDGGV